jgi:Ca-activated chloride channel family protein
LVAELLPLASRASRLHKSWNKIPIRVSLIENDLLQHNVAAPALVDQSQGQYRVFLFFPPAASVAGSVTHSSKEHAMHCAYRALRWGTGRIAIIAIVLGFFASIAGCPGKKDNRDFRAAGTGRAAAPGESYSRINDNPLQLAAHEPLSTFSIDVDTASYSNVRRFLQEGKLPPPDAVRVHDMINDFAYDYPQPGGGRPMSITTEVGPCPWNSRHQLVRIGLQGKTINKEDTPPRNLVFLVDTSGSMDEPNRLPLLKQGLGLLVEQLTARDRVAIVSYAGSAELVLPSTPANQRERIHAAIATLNPYGSTNGGGGIVMAYRIARENFIKGGANRVILGTDGDFNVGITGADLIRVIEEERKTGVSLTIFGFGMGNLKDSTMEQLARHGGGQYAYIDSFAEAQKAFVQDVGGLVVIARDVKVQVEFNPARVQAYRLIGYENRLLKAQDFNDDTKSATDMGAGQTVTALYELVPPGESVNVPSVDRLKYQKPAELSRDARGDELLTVKVRYTPPEGNQSQLLTAAVENSKAKLQDTSADYRFAAAVAAFGMLLRESEHRGDASYAQVLEQARAALGHDVRGYRAEFIELVQIAARLAKR